MKKKWKISLAWLIGIYLILSVLLFSPAVLIWYYISAIKIIESEMEFSFSNVHDLAENVIENQIEQLGFVLSELKSQTDFYYILCRDLQNGEHALSGYFRNNTVLNQLDILIAAELDNTLCYNGSSRFFPIESIIPDIIEHASNSYEGQIVRIRNDLTDLTVMLKSMPVIDKETGEVLGLLIGGRVLNGNLSLLELIRSKTKSQAAMFLEDGVIIGSTERFSSELSENIEKNNIGFENESFHFKKISGINIDGHAVISSYKTFFFRGNSASVKIGLVSVNYSFKTLEAFLLRFGLVMILLLSFFLGITIYILSRLTMPPLNRLLGFLEESAIRTGEIHYQTGIVNEFNTIGFAIEKMVTKLNSRKQKLIEEIAERKRIEEEIRLLNSELDNRVNQRTSELESVNSELNQKIIEYQEVVAELSKLSQAVHQAGNGIIITDTNGIIEFVNPAFTKMTLYENQEVIGRSTNILSSGKHSKDFFTGMWAVIEKGNTWKGEIINKKKTGELVWESATISPIIDSLGNINHYVAIKENISERKAMEHELLEAKNAAEAGIRVKSAFLANMSHEIRTPMNSVLGFIQLVLESKNLSEQDYSYLGIAKKSASGLLLLINDILDSSKLEAGRMEIENHKFNLTKFIKDSLIPMNLKAAEKDIVLSLEIKPELQKCIIGDSNRTRQVLINLLSNAIKFTDSGSVNLTVEKKNDDYILFTVADTGIGMTNKQIENIFKPFTQADQTTARKYGGTGLGTSICKQLVELMGGSIWVNSEIEKGSDFYFTIPLIVPECINNCNPDCEHYDHAEESNIPESKRSFKILVAEDIAENAILVSLRLKRKHHEVHVAKNGKEVITSLKNEKFDIILMDVHMPEMDGLEASVLIRKEENSNSHIPIIALTASIMTEDRQNCLNAGMDEVLGKPIDFDKLFSLMEIIIPEGEGKPVINIKSNDINDSSPLIPMELKGVDFSKGLELWQDEQIYINSLADFADGYSNTVEQLEILIKSGDERKAMELVHALKGVSANLAIHGVAEVSGEIYNYLSQGKSESAKNCLPQLSQNMETALKYISEIEIPKKSEQNPDRPMEDTEILASIEKLIDIFHRGEIDGELLSKLELNLKSRIRPVLLDSLLNAAEKFDFIKATQNLKSIYEILNDS